MNIFRGAFSVVKEGKELATGKNFAVKCINKTHIKAALLTREIEIMKKVNNLLLKHFFFLFSVNLD